jgi:hypothetical protein
MTNAYRRVVGDTGPPIEDTLMSDETPDDITGADVSIHITKPDDSLITADDSGAVTVESAEDGEVRYDFQDGDLDQEGRYRYEWEVAFTGGETVSYPSESERKIWVRQELD